MSADEKLNRWIWQPLTFGGVAAFARSSFARLFNVALVVALSAAASLVYFFHSAWEPCLRDGISSLPEEGWIRDGQLDWTEPAPLRLARGPFLAVVIDPAGTAEIGQGADLQLELNATHFRLRSLLGYIELGYPPNWNLPVNRPELEPWWGAWRSAVLVGLGLAVIISLLVVWAVLATLYVWPARAVALLTDRELTLAAAWRLAAASLLPGALMLSAAFVAYTLQRINLIQLLLAGLLHLALGWIFLLISPLRLPRLPSGSVRRGRKNPFGGNQS